MICSYLYVTGHDLYIDQIILRLKLEASYERKIIIIYFHRYYL